MSVREKVIGGLEVHARERRVCAPADGTGREGCSAVVVGISIRDGGLRIACDIRPGPGDALHFMQ